MAWHVGRTTGHAIYDGPGPDDMVAVTVGAPSARRALAALIVDAVNEREALLAALDDIRHLPCTLVGPCASCLADAVLGQCGATGD